MGKLENAFRTAMVGGFDRQDVLSFLERTGREHRRVEEGYRQTIKSLEEECALLRSQPRVQENAGELLQAELEADRARLAKEWSALEAERADLKKESQRVTVERETLEKEHAALAEERKALAAEREQITREKRELGYARDRISDARRAAEEEAGRIMEDVEKRLTAAEERYNAYTSGVELAAASVLRKLEAMRGQVLALPSVVSALPFPGLSRIEALDDMERVQQEEHVEEAVLSDASFTEEEKVTLGEAASLDGGEPVPSGINWAAILGPADTEEDEEKKDDNATLAYQEYNFMLTDDIAAEDTDGGF